MNRFFIIVYLLMAYGFVNAQVNRAVSDSTRPGASSAKPYNEAPVGDSNWDIDDAAHSAIVYKPSVVPNASGPNVHDPRTGEILEAHINWYHNVMSLVHDWFLIQTAAVDFRARKPLFDDELMGQLIRFVVSHEVGHTLGLLHNFGSSSTVPVDSLRSNHFLSIHGHTPSIMDYARFNYIAQPEDNISEANLFPRIGAYDKWAIEWGYRWFRDKESREQERQRLNRWVIARTGADPSLWFGTESDPSDPREQSEDLGDDAMKSGAYGIKNLQRILPLLPDWIDEPGHDYQRLKEVYAGIVKQYGGYMDHIARDIGGIETTAKTTDQPGTVIAFVPRARQEEVMQFLQQQLFNTPSWLLDKKIFGLTGESGVTTLSGLQNQVLNSLLRRGTFDRLIRFEADDPIHAYTPGDLFRQLTDGIWSELRTGHSIDIYRRDIQNIYTEKMVALLDQSKLNDDRSVLRGQVVTLLATVRNALPAVLDQPSRLHLQDCAHRMEDALNPRK
jgi:hypothetical protein